MSVGASRPPKGAPSSPPFALPLPRPPTPLQKRPAAPQQRLTWVRLPTCTAATTGPSACSTSTYRDGVSRATRGGGERERERRRLLRGAGAHAHPAQALPSPVSMTPGKEEARRGFRHLCPERGSNARAQRGTFFSPLCFHPSALARMLAFRKGRSFIMLFASEWAVGGVSLGSGTKVDLKGLE